MRELILNFHGIGTKPVTVSEAEAAVWWDEVPFLRVLDELASVAQEFEYPIAITFDDGNVSDATIALPALAKRGMKATFFVCAARIGQVHYVDAAAIADLLQAGMTIGSHGMNHVDWRLATERELDAEMADARLRIEDVCGRKIHDVAIPFGSYDRRVMSRLKRENWRHVYSSDGGFARVGAWFKPRQSLSKAWEQQAIISNMRATDTWLMSILRRLRRFQKQYR